MLSRSGALRAHDPYSGAASIASPQWQVRPAGLLPPRRGVRPYRVPARQLVLPFPQPETAPTPRQPEPICCPQPAAHDARTLGAQLLLLSAQTALGARPVEQAIRWTTNRVYDELRRRHRRAVAVHASGTAAPATITVIGIRVQQVTPRVLECSAIVVTRGRSQGATARAIAIRVIEHQRGWWVTDIEL